MPLFGSLVMSIVGGLVRDLGRWEDKRAVVVLKLFNFILSKIFFCEEKILLVVGLSIVSDSVGVMIAVSSSRETFHQIPNVGSKRSFSP